MMSTECLSWALKAQGLPLAEKMTLICLADMADHKGELRLDCDHISAAGSLTETKLTRAISSLAKRGLIEAHDGLDGICVIKKDESAPFAVQRRSSRRRQDGQVSSTNSEAFDDFWREYPNKQGKHNARLKWAKMTDNDRQAALIDVCKRKASCDQWIRDKGKFIPHCSTYLNQRQWEDDWAPEVAGGSDIGDFF